MLTMILYIKLLLNKTLTYDGLSHYFYIASYKAKHMIEYKCLKWIMCSTSLRILLIVVSAAKYKPETKFHCSVEITCKW